MDQPRLFIKDPQDNLITVISEGYFNVELTSYLTGAATTLSFSFVKDEDSYEQIVTGCKVAFIYKGKDYWMNIVQVSQDEDIMTVTAWGVSLELSNETVAPYKATKPMSFAEYANLWNYEKTFEIGINEVSDKKITHEWEGADKTLGRLLSLATVFDAEVEFVTYLDDFHNLDRLVMNVYKAHSETNQGLGLDSRQMVFRFGNEIETVSKEESAKELYTAITPTGKDGLNISSIEFEKFDADGNLEFCTYKTAKPNFPDVRKIYAPLAKLRHPSYRGQTRDEWTNFNWETEYTTANDLSGNALSKLKTISVPVFTWDIVGVIDAGIGDTVTIEDDGYEPTLYLEARVSEQTIDFSDESKNKTTFTNVLEVGSAVDMSLLSRMEALIEANKTYVGSIQTTNGIVFKNNTGTTDLTAVVRLGTQTVTDNYDISWYKDGTEIANTATITVTATDVVEKALYKFEAKDADGVLVASYEVTVSDVSDGEEGRGISSTKVEYQASTSGTTVPSGAWLTNPPTVSDGQYLWTRTTFTYTDDTTTLSYSVSRMGTTGTNGVGISDVTVTYQAGTSGTTPPTGTWTTTIPSVTANQFLWTRTVTTYTDSSTSTAYSVGKMGANGANAQLLYLSASANVISFDSNDIVEPNQTVTITAKLQNATGTIVWTAIPYIGNAAQTPITLSGTGNSRTLTSGNWTNPNWTSVAVTATLGSLTDTISVVKVADGAAAYVHTAWKMPDGTFSMEYPEENTYSTQTQFQSLSGGVLPVREEETAPRGFRFTGVQGGSGSFRIRDVIKGNGIWTVKFKARQSQSYSSAGFSLDICDSPSPAKRFTLNQDNSWTEISLTVEVKNWSSTMNFVDFSGIDWLYFFVSDFKVSKGTGGIYTPSPIDDFANAYPKWEGSYSDNLETASDNPADYEPWKIIKGQDGQSQKVHRGWKMPDGTFTKVYPLDNMLLNSKLLNMNSWGAFGLTPTFSSEYVTLVKSVTTSGRAVFNQNINVSQLKQGQTYSISLMVNVKSASGANAGKSQVFLRTQTSSSYADSPAGDIDLTKLNQWQTINVSGKIMSGTITASQFTIAVSHDVIATIDVKKPKLVLGESALPWTPNPSEDPLNAYPSLEGMYADFNEEGSNNPDDYAPWTPIRGEDGTDAKEVFSGYLTNESIVLPANPNGVVTDFSKATGNFVTFLGQDQLSSGVAYSLESATGITTTINATTGAYSITAISADIGVAIYKAVYSGITIRKQVMVVKAAQGASGVGLTTTTITYQAGTSGTTAPTGTWSTTVPTVPAGQFLWTRTVWEFSDGTSKTGYSISKAGETGATGNGIASSAITYASSTSGTTVPTSGWQATIPTVAEGSFLWTRTIFTYTNGNTNTSYAVAKQGEKGDPTGILAQSTVPTAAQRYVGMLWKNTGASGYINGATYRWNGSAFELYIFTAENMSVSNLAAISANLGTITAGTLNGTTINGSTFINSFTYTEGSVTYTGTTTIENGNVIISRTGSDGSTWTTKVDRTLGFEDSYRASASAPARTTRLGQGQLYMVEAGVGGYLPARSLNNTSWTNLPLASGWSAAENNPPQYRIFPQIDGSTIIKFRGQFTNTAGSMAAGSHRPFGVNSFPDIIKPNRTEFSWAPTNTRQGGRLSVTTAGDFQFQVDFTCTYAAISMLSYIIE